MLFRITCAYKLILRHFQYSFFPPLISHFITFASQIKSVTPRNYSNLCTCTEKQKTAKITPLPSPLILTSIFGERPFKIAYLYRELYVLYNYRLIHIQIILLTIELFLLFFFSLPFCLFLFFGENIKRYSSADLQFLVSDKRVRKKRRKIPSTNK